MNRAVRYTLLASFVLAVLWVAGCDGCGPGPIKVTFSGAPSTGIANSGSSLTATVTNDGRNLGVYWTCTPVGSCGTFNPAQSGSGDPVTYTPPPSATTVTICATSEADPTKSFCVTIPIDAYLAFYLSGYENNEDEDTYGLAGSVEVDPTGKVLGGEQDYNDADAEGGVGASSAQITGGSLTVNLATGQGTLTLVTNNAKVGVSGTETLGLQAVNSAHALIIQFDGSATSSGSLDTQTLPSTPTGGFAFAVSGVDNEYYSVVLGGVFTISGANIQNGFIDVNDSGYPPVLYELPYSGTIAAPDKYGRGTLTLNASGEDPTLVYYIVGPEAMRLIRVEDPTQFVVGSAYGQGASALKFNNALVGSYAFLVEGNVYSFPVYAAAGMITTTKGEGLPFTGVGDVNEEGFPASAQSLSGNWFMDNDGYGGLGFSAGKGLEDIYNLGVYAVDPKLNILDPNNPSGGGGALVVDLDGSSSFESPLNGVGVLLPQTDTTSADVNGTWAFGAQDFPLGGLCAGCYEFDFVGQGTISSLAFSGTGMISDPGKLFSSKTTDSGVSFAGSGESSTATIVPDEENPGRYTISNQTIGTLEYEFHVTIYQASSGQLLWVEMDDLSLWGGTLQTLTPLP